MTKKKEVVKEHNQIFLAVYTLGSMNKMTGSANNGIEYTGPVKYFYDRDCIPKMLKVARVFTFPELKEITQQDIKIG
jgi:hypothetical protein